MESDPPAEAPLICAECGLESPPDAAGWRAYLDDDALIELMTVAVVAEERIPEEGP
jgi:hypothetical protein